MIRTSQEILNMLYALVKASEWVTGQGKISGKVYFDEMRPRDSVLEDAVLIHTAGTTGQIQSGVVTILVYVPDVRPFSNGASAPNLGRMDTLGRKIQAWISALKPDVSTSSGSQRDIQFHQHDMPIVTGYDPDCRQHYLSIRLNYRTITL